MNFSVFLLVFDIAPVNDDHLLSVVSEIDDGPFGMEDAWVELIE